MADLVLIRDIFTLKMTLGQMFYKGQPLVLSGSNIYIGEDVARAKGVKIDKETAISEGDYWIDITFSNRFQKDMPLIFNDEVNLLCLDGSKSFSGVRQHSGNTEADTDACQLLGLGRNSNGVWKSHDALDLYIPFLSKLILDARGKIPYQIINKQA